MTQLQVQTMSDQELNRKFAELMGYTVKELPLGHNGRQLYALVTPSGRQRIASLSIDSAYLDAPFYCTDPAASLEVQAKAIEIDAQWYLNALSQVVNRYIPEDTWKDNAIIAMLNASPRERAEAAYITLYQSKGDK